MKPPTLQRKAIRQAIAAELRGKTYAGDNVEDGGSEHYEPAREGGAPKLFVYTLSDVRSDQGSAASGRIYARELEVAVEVWVEEQATGKRREDMLDDLCGQVELIVDGALPKLPGVKVEPIDEAVEIGGDPSRTGFQRVELGFDNRGRQLLGAARVIYLVVYEVQVDPRTMAELVPFDGANVTWDFPPPDFTPEAVDEITLEGG